MKNIIVDNAKVMAKGQRDGQARPLHSKMAGGLKAKFHKGVSMGGNNQSTFAFKPPGK
jgi:hypothetical protein